MAPVVAMLAHPVTYPHPIYSGKKWDDLDRGYLEWVVKQTDMDEDAVYTAKYWLKEKAKG